jgi:hypothetical protein
MTRRLRVVVGAAGAYTIPHGVPEVPSYVSLAATYAAAGPAAGANVYFDNTTVTNAVDGTNVYVYASAAGTFDLVIGF